jgi:uncharacterized membrane protein
MEFIIFVLCIISIVLWSRTTRLRDRVEHMERYLADATKQLQSTVSTPSAPTSTQTPVINPSVVPVANTQTEPHVLTTFFAWCATDWLMKLGGFLVLLGLGWFVSYAFAHALIGPMGRIALGLITGALVLALGRYRLQSYVTQGAILMFVGAADIVLTVYAGREVYDFFSPVSALVLMFLTSALLGVTSVIVRHKPLAYGTALLAGAAPLLVASPTPDLVGLFSYLLVVSISALVLAGYTGWREIILASLLLVGFYSSEWLIGYEHTTHQDAGLLFAFVFSALFFGASIASVRMARKVSMVDVCIALGTGVYLLSWILTAATPAWQSVLLSAWTLVFAFGAYVAVRQGVGNEFFYAYGGVGALYLAVALSLLLEGPALTVAWTIEATLALALSWQVTHRADRVWWFALPLVVPLMLSFESMDGYLWQGSVLHEHMVVLCSVLTALLGIGTYFAHEAQRALGTVSHTVQTVAHTAYSVAGVYVIVLTWLVVHALTYPHYDVGTTSTLVVYTLTASYLFVSSKVTGVSWRRQVAIGLFGLVVGRLLLVDVWEMALSGRIGTFLMIGGLLIVVAWLERGAKQVTGAPLVTHDNVENHA